MLEKTGKQEKLLHDAHRLKINWRRVLERDEALYASRPEHSSPQYWENALALAACAQEVRVLECVIENMRAAQSALEVA